MSVALVNVEGGVFSVGFRRLAGHARGYCPDLHSLYVTVGRRSLKEHIFPSAEKNQDDGLSEEVAENLVGHQVVAFSSMSINATMVEKVIARLREKAPETLIVWGGCHSIMDPDSAVHHADAVCTGEGEVAFQQLLDAVLNERDYFETPNFWFRRGSEVKKNGFLPLHSNEDLGGFPPPEYGNPTERIFVPGSGFVPMTRDHYLRFNGLAYRTVWTLGCPFRCTYCGNSRFIDNDQAFRKIRHSPVSNIMNELQQVKEVHPHVRSIIFDDDSFMALRTEVLEDFANQYREKVGIPFTVTGVIPNYVQERKIQALLEAGMIRLRMGIQSGSDRILEFYQRPSSSERVLEAARIINKFRRTMIPPAYDIIVDNPIETRDDVRDTLQLIYDLPRPFTLNISSLRVLPNTVLSTQLEDLGIRGRDFHFDIKDLSPTLANAMLYLLCVVRIPQGLFRSGLARVRTNAEQGRTYPILNRLMRILWLARRGFDHLRFMDWVNLPGHLGFVLAKLGVVDFWHRFLSPNRKVLDRARGGPLQ